MRLTLSVGSLLEVRAWLESKLSCDSEIVGALLREVEEAINMEIEAMAHDTEGPGSVEPLQLDLW